jgi:hypothetical protein
MKIRPLGSFYTRLPYRSVSVSGKALELYSEDTRFEYQAVICGCPSLFTQLAAVNIGIQVLDVSNHSAAIPMLGL